MSKIKPALEVVQNLRKLAGSLETLILVMENRASEKAPPPQESEPNEKEKSNGAKQEAKTKPPNLEEVRRKLASLSQDGKQAQVKALITELGAKKLSDVPAEKYSELLEKVEEL